MDIDAFHSALLSLTLLPEQISAIRANGSTVANKGSSDSPVSVDGLQRDLRIAKATLASELGFAICACCWPPEIFATDENGRTFCPRTGHKRLRRAPGSRLSGESIRPKPRRVDRFTRTQKEKLLELRERLTNSVTGAEAACGGELLEIEQALQRIDRGTYGTCEGSGEPIPRARLEALPAARYTVEYQARLEEEWKARPNPQPEINPVELDDFCDDDRGGIWRRSEAPHAEYLAILSLD